MSHFLERTSVLVPRMSVPDPKRKSSIPFCCGATRSPPSIKESCCARPDGYLDEAAEFITLLGGSAQLGRLPRSRFDKR